ncbi:hypothetical protein Aduo_002152 [Ancylostoma duodenale]
MQQEVSNGDDDGSVPGVAAVETVEALADETTWMETSLQDEKRKNFNVEAPLTEVKKYCFMKNEPQTIRGMYSTIEKRMEELRGQFALSVGQLARRPSVQSPGRTPEIKQIQPFKTVRNVKSERKENLARYRGRDEERYVLNMPRKNLQFCFVCRRKEPLKETQSNSLARMLKQAEMRSSGDLHCTHGRGSQCSPCRNRK